MYADLTEAGYGTLRIPEVVDDFLVLRFYFWKGQELLWSALAEVKAGLAAPQLLSRSEIVFLQDVLCLELQPVSVVLLVVLVLLQIGVGVVGDMFRLIGVVRGRCTYLRTHYNSYFI